MSTFGCSCESIDLIAQITKVILADLKIEDFINDRCEVSKRADEAERRRITVAKEAAGGSEQQGVLDGNQATSYLESAEHVTQRNVSDQLSMDKMIVSDVVKTLEKRNFLTREPRSGPESRRHVQRDFHQARHQIHRQSRVVAP